MFICFVFPFVLVVINAFKTQADITTNALSLVGKHGFTFDNFPKAMEKMNFGNALVNSFIITTASTVLTILLSSMTAFLMVRNQWKLNGILFGLMIASMVIPFQVLMIPLVSLYGGELAMLPILILYLFLQRYIVEGVTAGAVK